MPVVDFEKFHSQLKGEIAKEYPMLRRQKKPVLKTQEQLLEEALTVKKMLTMAPTLPQRAGEVYHIIAIDWWQQWKTYTGFHKAKINGIKEGINGILDQNDGEETANSTTYQEEENTMSDDFQKLQIHKDKGNNTQSPNKYPGLLNGTPGFDKLLVTEPYLKHPNQL